MAQVNNVPAVQTPRPEIRPAVPLACTVAHNCNPSIGRGGDREMKCRTCSPG